MNKETINAQIISLIRTFVPVLVGQIITWLATQGILDATGEIGALLITAFTLILPLLTTRWLGTWKHLCLLSLDGYWATLKHQNTRGSAWILTRLESGWKTSSSCQNQY